LTEGSQDQGSRRSKRLCRLVWNLTDRGALRSSSGGTLSSPCKHLIYAALCILSCCSFYLEFTSLADYIVTKELFSYTPLLYKRLKTISSSCTVRLKAPVNRFLEGAQYKFSNE